MTLLHRARRAVQALGVDVRRFPEDEVAFRRAKLLAHHGIDHVFDVGASDGRYGAELRRFGYRGAIVSFEPLQTAFRKLSQKAEGDHAWTALPFAVGPRRGTVQLNVAGNAGASSSILPMLDRHTRIEPSAAYVDRVSVEQYPLDEIWSRYAGPRDRIFLKIDVQGYEHAVLDGATELTQALTGIQVELSLAPLYEGALLYDEMIGRIRSHGFELMLVEPGFSDAATGRTLQIDAVFFRGDGGAHAQEPTDS